MSAHAYSEDQLVEQPAIGLFAALGWQPVSAMEETFGAGGTLGRETKGEAVLVERLRAALCKFNPTLPPEAISNAVDELTRDRSAMSLEAANHEVYGMLKEGITVSVPDRDALSPGPSPRGRGGQTTERLRVVDWEHPENNDFLLVSQFSVTGALYTCRPDLVGFVNGLPWVVIELKKPGVPARAAFDENLTHYKQQVPALFWSNAFLIASNGTDSRVGSLTADWERWVEWKRIEREDEPRRVSLEVVLRGTCDRARLLDLVENFTLFSEHKAGLVKILGQNHQFLGVNNAIASMLEARKMGHGRGGVFWQTQGSGKSFSMVFFAQKVLRKLTGNWTFVVVTDRVELDEQIAKTFKTAGAVSEAEGDACHAASGTHLRELLRGNHRYVFTLVHKFQTPELLCDRSDVIVLTDEAHRSQYDTLALNMRAALPKAMVVSIDKATALRMHDKVKAHWAAETERVQKDLAELAYLPRRRGMTAEQARRDLRMAELKQRLSVLTTTDMAVIVSPGQNEIQQMQKLGLDIKPHRKRMNESQPGLDEKFKDTDDPLRLVFVCAMWLTGFDAPSCSTVYLDKPMRNHTLMQTIARANRVFPGKHSGVIVDYANVFASLEKALAIYGAGKDGKSPVKDKQQLVEELCKAVADATAFCAKRDVLLAEIEQFATGSLERLQRIEDAMNALISPDPLRRDFLGHERLVSTLYRAVKPDPSALEFAGRVAGLTTLAEAIRVKLSPNPPDISQVMGQISGLLNESIIGHEIRESGPPTLDLSKINFEALAQRFKKSGK
jgi:type I site-specific restriction-modification system R (restriction) subunit